MNTTNIAWTDYSWNPWQGCKKISSACDNCYMYREKKRFGQKGMEIYRSTNTTFNKPLKIKENKKVFTCSWSDFFIEEADEWRDEAWDIIRNTPHLTYQILTKRPENIKDRLPEDWNENFKHVWLGATVENQKQANIRIPELLNIAATKRFISIEPMIDSINLCSIEKSIVNTKYIINALNGSVIDHETGWSISDSFEEQGIEHSKIDWIIVGGETGAKSKTRPMDAEWIQKIYDDCEKYKTPFFFKQWGSHKPSNSFEFENVQEFPKGLK